MLDRPEMKWMVEKKLMDTRLELITRLEDESELQDIVDITTNAHVILLVAKDMNVIEEVRIMDTMVEIEDPIHHMNDEDKNQEADHAIDRNIWIRFSSEQLMLDHELLDKRTSGRILE